ncbi:hypothetical protein TNCV_1500461 [Trichonephila clavipes]|nr:hypothetical protein TNCV_1500461 [Trichonephila clavipes]
MWLALSNTRSNGNLKQISTTHNLKYLGTNRLDNDRISTKLVERLFIAGVSSISCSYDRVESEMKPHQERGLGPGPSWPMPQDRV